MKPTSFLFALSLFPAIGLADVGRAENAKQEKACEQARTNAEATCKESRAKTLSKCDCVERATTLYLKNWRCAVRATCESDSAEPRESDENQG